MLFLTVNGGNEATQLLRKMINCRSLGIPFSPQLHHMSMEQPMALLKVNKQQKRRNSKKIHTHSFFSLNPIECTKASWKTKTIMPESFRSSRASNQENKYWKFISISCSNIRRYGRIICK